MTKVVGSLKDIDTQRILHTILEGSGTPQSSAVGRQDLLINKMYSLAIRLMGSSEMEAYILGWILNLGNCNQSR